jgi:hypothetical protein
MDGAGAGTLECGRSDRGRRTGRVDIVYHRHDCWRSRGGEGVLDILPSRGTRQPALPSDGPGALQQGHGGKLPAGCELAREPLCGIDATPAASVGVPRDPCQRVDARRRDVLRDEVGGEPCDPAEPALLPGADDPARGALVRDGRAGRAEGKAPAGALAAALHGPGRGSAAAGAEGPAEAEEASAALRAEEPSFDPAGDAPLGKQEIEKAGADTHPGGRVEAESARNAHRPSREWAGRVPPARGERDPAAPTYFLFRSLIFRLQVAVSVSDGSLSEVAVSVTRARLDEPGVRVT